MDLAAVMDEIGDQLDTIDGLRVHRFPPDQVHPPAAVVTYPDTYEFDATFGRGSDRLSLPVMLMVGRAWDRAARDALAVYMAGSGAASVKAVVESGAYTAFDSVRVQDVEVDVVRMAGVDHLAAEFTLDIIGPGTEAPLVDYSRLNVFTPGDHNLQTWTFDPHMVQGGTGTPLAGGLLKLDRLNLRGPVSVDTAYIWTTVAGSGLTADQNYIGLYAPDGTRLVSVDADVAFAATAGLQTIPLGATVDLVAPFVWFAWVANGTTLPAIARATTTAGGTNPGNVGLTAAGARTATNGSGRTSLPASIVPGSNNNNFAAFWCALS